MESIGSYLEQDHARCDELLREAQQSVRGASWRQARLDMAAFQHALERHLLIEERILFPAFERALGRAVSPTAAMRGEHLRIRAVAQRLSDTVAAHDMGAFVNHAEALLLLLHQHSEKEEGVLYPMIERVLVRSSAELVGAMQAFGTYAVCASAA
ncbi:MAG: hemerythrin domain-containing protein [Pseudomonadota bacterium]